MIRSSSRTILTAAVAATALILAGCSGGKDAPTSGNDTSTNGTQSGSAVELNTLVPGKLTIATGEPAYSPWVENDDPASGEGLEAAVAYAVAEELGFSKEDVVWVRTPFDTVIAPGPKEFDLNIQQFSSTPEREQAVDFSSPYYTTSQAVLSIKGKPGADATSIADLKDVKIGVAAGTSTINVVKDVIDPSNEVAIFNSNEDTVQALLVGNIDVLVTDLPTALYLSAAEIDNGVVVGQLDSTEGGDEFAFLLPKGSTLTVPVTEALDALRERGVLEELAQTWIAEGAGVPVLK